MLSIASVAFVAVAVLRLIWDASSEPILLLELVPIVLIALQFGRRMGLIAAALSLGLWCLYAASSSTINLDATSFLLRAPLFLLVGGLVGWLSDLAARNLRLLSEREKDLRFIAEESADTISTHTPDGDYTYVSTRCYEMLGYTPQELLGTSAYEYFHPDDLALIQDTHSVTLNRPEIATMTYRSRRKDGTYLWFETRMRSRHHPRTGEVEALHCATREISALERLGELDRRAVDQARTRIDRHLADGGPSIAYQPIFHLGSRRMVAVEALARFEGEPAQGPDVWFAEAWRAGRGLDLELAAIRNAIAGFRDVPENLVLAVNASAETVQASELPGVVGELASRIVIEVTEHADLKNVDEFVKAVTALRELGIRLAIDDVGTGFSGLSRLLDISADVIKLDLSLTRDIDNDDRRASLASSLVAFGHEAETDVVAEGIETQAELDALMERGVRFGQGYYLGRPTQTLADLAPTFAFPSQPLSRAAPQAQTRGECSTARLRPGRDIRPGPEQSHVAEQDRKPFRAV